MLRNLLENARKYGGPTSRIEADPTADDWMIVVSDNGTGHTRGPDRERIFERFEQLDTGDARSDGGLGLGLTITRRLVEAMGGRIWYEPGFPIGARFCFTLPVGTRHSGSRGTRGLRHSTILGQDPTLHPGRRKVRIWRTWLPPDGATPSSTHMPLRGPFRRDRRNRQLLFDQPRHRREDRCGLHGPAPPTIRACRDLGVS